MNEQYIQDESTGMNGWMTLTDGWMNGQKKARKDILITLGSNEK